MKRVKLTIDGAECGGWYTPLDLVLSYWLLVVLGQSIGDVIRYSELIYTPPWSPGLWVSAWVDAVWIGALLLVRWVHRIGCRHARNQEAMWRRM